LLLRNKINNLENNRKLENNEEFHNLCSLSNYMRIVKSNGIRWAEHVGSLGNMRDSNKSSARNPEVKTPLRRLSHKLVDNITKKLEWTGFI
jgi:hypothetical protein